MEVDQATASTAETPAPRWSEAGGVMAGPSFQPSVSLHLHPLVIMNIADHWTRIRAQQDGQAEAVVGALLGKQKSGRIIEVCNSFELEVLKEENVETVVQSFFDRQLEQFKRVFEDLELIGWYSSGGPPDETDQKLHKQICSYYNDNLILMKLDPRMPDDGKLPVALFESVIDMEDEDATILFGPVPCSLVTEEAERIGLDNMVRLTVSSNTESSLASQHLRTQHSAIKMLHSRVKIVQEYVKAVGEGKIQPNWAILREITSLCRQLPVVETREFREDFYNQCNDVALQTFLGTVTKCCDSMNMFVNKFNVLYDRQGGPATRRTKRANF